MRSQPIIEPIGWLDGLAVSSDHRGMVDEYPRTGGCLRRKIDLQAKPDSCVIAWLEDDFHHIGLTLEHDGKQVTAIRIAAERLPFSTCPHAALNLQPLVGCHLSRRSTDIGATIDMRQQCTHMFDLAGLAMAHAANSRIHREYEAIIDDREIIAWEPGHRRLLGAGEACLLRDGEEVLHWQIDGRVIVGPTEWAGQSLVDSFRARTEALPFEEAEAATVLRRAIMVSSGRTIDQDRFATASERGLRGACYTFLDENRDKARRVYGSSMNYENSGQDMLSRLAERP